VGLEGSRGKFKFKVILFKELMNKLRFEAEKKNDPARSGKARFRYTIHSVINRKDPEIRKFYTTLRDLLSESAVALKFLRPEDFGPDFTLLEGQKRSLLQDAQRLAVEATAETGTDQSDAELLKAAERLIAVGTTLSSLGSGRPPHRSGRAALPHPVLALDRASNRSSGQG